MTADGKRRRTAGGSIWNISKSCEPEAYKEIMMKGRKIPIKNARTRVSILKAQALEKDLYSSAASSLTTEKHLAVFDKIFRHTMMPDDMFGMICSLQVTPKM